MLDELTGMLDGMGLSGLCRQRAGQITAAVDRKRLLGKS